MTDLQQTGLMIQILLVYLCGDIFHIVFIVTVWGWLLEKVLVGAQVYCVTLIDGVWLGRSVCSLTLGHSIQAIFVLDVHLSAPYSFDT